MRARPSVCLVLASIAFGACASSSMLGAARRGDLAALRASIADGERRASLTKHEAQSIARATIERAIRDGEGEDGARRVREAWACAPDVDPVLAARSRTHDEAGAEAALARLDDRKMTDADARKILDTTAATGAASRATDAWRAVGTRGLVRTKDGDARRRAMRDPSPRVRRAAMRAAAAAADPADFDALLEAARLDPDPMARTEALRAIVPLARAGTGGLRIANAFRDLWATADPGLREDIAVAWAISPLYETGGRDALRVILGEAKGSGAIAGAGAILRAPKGRTDPEDLELVATARATLVAGIAHGSLRDRLHAIAEAPIANPGKKNANANGDLLDAMRAAAKDDDPEVTVAALSRLAESAPDRAAAITALEAMAAPSNPSPTLASRARLSLARAGDARAQAWIESDLMSPDAASKIAAADALVALDRAARAAPLLADPDPSVRTRAACAILETLH